MAPLIVRFTSLPDSLPRLLGLPSPHAHGQRQADAPSRHRVPAIEIREHEGRRVGVGHDHLRNQRPEDRQHQRGGKHAGVCRKPEPEARRSRCAAGPVPARTHRPSDRDKQAPVQARPAQSLEVDTVRPVGGLHLWQVDSAAPGWIEIEECRACQKPADRLLRAGSESTAVTSRSMSATNVSPSATWPAQLISASCPLIRSSGTCALEIAGVNRHPSRSFRRQFGRRADEHGDVVAGGDAWRSTCRPRAQSRQE